MTVPYFDSEDVYCAEVTNATVDSPEFETCLTRVQQKKDNEESKRRWMWIVGFLAAFFIAFICEYLQEIRIY